MIRIVPLGGLGEIGMNCLAIEDGDDILVVDCGISFPHDDLGIDTYHPRLDWLAARRDRVRGLVLTHGHEDHVGAVPYFVDEVGARVHGPAHAVAVARERVRDRLGSATRFAPEVVAPGAEFRVGRFSVEPIRVAHSIVDATALAIGTSEGTVIHTGDFKMDPTPPDGEPTDEARLEALGDRGVRLLLSDSTNIDARSAPASEASVGEALAPLVESADARVVVAMFASNVQRLKLVGEIALRARRKIALLGRSVQMQVRIAHAIGRLDWPSDLVVRADELASMPRRRVLAIAGGTQAEPGSALARIAKRTHPSLSLDPGDTVIFSSRVIPGNDVPVFALMGDLLRQGVEVRNWITDPGVHVSGHAHRSEQRRMLELARPRSFVPVHGTLHHLVRHAALAREVGVGDVLVLENGDVAELDGGALAKAGRVEVGRVATWDGQELVESVLSERASLGRAGVVHVTLVADARGKLAAPPAVVARGVAAESLTESATRKVALEVARTLGETPWAVERPSDEAIADVARAAARRAFEAIVGKKPVAMATVVRL